MALECDLAEPVFDWLKSRGFTPYGEVRWYNRAIDVVGLDVETVVAIELKMSLTRHVRYQAHLNQLASNYSWAAVGTRPRKLPFGPFETIGVLSVVGGKVEVIREADPSPRANDYHLKAIRGVCHYKEPCGVAGLPGMAGIGPAQDVYNAMVKFIAENPKAKWQEIWEQVPNHYKHARSMQGAMRIVRDVRAYRERRRLKKMQQT
jgi:hypothetical protein